MNPGGRHIPIITDSDDEDYEPMHDNHAFVTGTPPGPTIQSTTSGLEGEDEALQRAIEASMQEHLQQQQKRSRSPIVVEPDDDDFDAQLREAIRRSKENQMETASPPSAPGIIPAESLAPRPAPAQPDALMADEDADLQEAIRLSMQEANGEEGDYPPVQRMSSGQRIIRAQDQEYFESLRQDRLKQEERTREEKRRREEEARRQAAERAEREKEQRKQLSKQQKRDALPAEPPAEAQHITSLVIRFPNGVRLSRRFNLGDKLQVVRDFIESREEIDAPDNYYLAADFPRREFRAVNQTLEQCGLDARALLNVVAEP